MVTPPSGVARFFFDRNLGRRVPAALRGAGWLVEVHDDHFGEETPDPVLLREIAARGWVFISQDRRIRRRPAERRALRESGRRTFLISSTANLTAAVTIEVLTAAKPAIHELLDTNPGPFVVAIRRSGDLKVLPDS